MHRREEPRRDVAEEDVFPDAEIRDEIPLLVDRDDTQAQREAGRKGVHQLPVHADFASVAAVHTGKDLDECRLARAILSDDGVHTRGGEVQVHAVKDLHAREALRDAADTEDAFCGTRHGVSTRARSFGRSRRSPQWPS